ncbi:unnamed protein product, partial [Polarella glacialis]
MACPHLMRIATLILAVSRVLAAGADVAVVASVARQDLLSPEIYLDHLKSTLEELKSAATVGVDRLSGPKQAALLLTAVGVLGEVPAAREQLERLAGRPLPVPHEVVEKLVHRLQESLPRGRSLRLRGTPQPQAKEPPLAVAGPWRTVSAAIIVFLLCAALGRRRLSGGGRRQRRAVAEAEQCASKATVKAVVPETSRAAVLPKVPSALDSRPVVEVCTDVAGRMAALVAETAEAAIASRGAFTIAIAGGSLVKMLGAMAEMPGLQWQKWHVAWVDERCVPHADPESNYGGAKEEWLSKVPIPSAQIYAIDEKLCPGTGSKVHHISWVKLMLDDTNRRHKWCDKDFAAADKDGSGSLSADEVVALVSKICTTMSIKVPPASKVAELVKLCCKSKDGELRPNEFRTVFKAVLQSCLHEAAREVAQEAAADYQQRLRSIPEAVLL